MVNREYVLSRSCAIVLENKNELIYEGFSFRSAVATVTEPVTEVFVHMFDAVFKIFESEEDAKRIYKEQQAQQQRIRKFLKQQGIDDKKIDKIIKEAKQRDFKNIDEIFTFDFIMKEFAEELKNIQAKDILILIVSLILMLILESLLSLIFLPIVGPVGAAILTSVLIAPLVEEAFKRAAVKNYKGFTLTAGFAAIEGVMYVVKYVALGVPAAVMIFVRILSFFLHLITLFFHKKGQVQASFAEMYDDDKAKKLPKDLIARATVAAQAIHAYWNGFVSLLVATGHGVAGVASAAALARIFHKGL